MNYEQKLSNMAGAFLKERMPWPTFEPKRICVAWGEGTAKGKVLWLRQISPYYLSFAEGKSKKVWSAHLEDFSEENLKRIYNEVLKVWEEELPLEVYLKLLRAAEDIPKEIIAAIKSDETLAKHILKHTWISGSSTEVYPITLWAYEVCVQLDSPRRMYDKCVERILRAYPHLFKDGYFRKNDDSCPAELVFRYTDETRERLMSKQ